MPADRDDLAVAPALELGQRRVGLAPQLGADRLERVLGDVEAERLLLQAQKLVLLELLRADRRVLGLLLGLARRASSGRSAGRSAPAARARARARAPRASRAACAPLESSAPHLTSDSSARLFTTCGSTRSVKSQSDANAPPSVARVHDRPRRGVADVLDRVQPEADLALDDREVVLRTRSRRAAAPRCPSRGRRRRRTARGPSCSSPRRSAPPCTPSGGAP